MNVYVDLTNSEGGLERPEGFSGQVEPTVSAYGTKVRLFCIPTRMLIGSLERPLSLCLR